MSRAAPTRVLLADDHNLVRAGVRRILESHHGVQVVGEVGDGESALRALDATPADVLVLDLTMPGMDGFEVLRRARAAHPRLRMLVLTMHTTPAYVSRAIREGADGYLLKDSAVQDLMTAIGSVMEGRAYYSPPIQRELGEILRTESAGRRPLDQLTEREREVLRLVAAGLSTKEIAGRLAISGRTVESHRARLMGKLGLRSVALLTQFAIREGMLADP
ncbi:MAG: response regulator transcription factor [Candidatus Eisenbacteria bacterium]|nr:response regulator transcription factor [Candidatus Eisenbacteria bacterium]